MIHGKDIIIYEGDENPVAIAASKSCTVDKVAGTIETSSPASGVARSYASGRTDWVATLNNLVLSVKDYMLRVGETYYLTIGVRGSSTDTISGYAICTECNVTGTVGNLAQGSFRFQGSDREGTIPPQPGETGYDMTEDQVTAIVYNVVGDGYLSRLHNDTAQGLITFSAGAYIPVGQYLRIGDAYLTYDAEYGMLKVWDGSGVVERGLYATGSVSALGAASGGGGGGGGGGDMDRDSMFAILSGAPASASEWINAKFLKLGPGLAASNDGTLTITGAVTSVGLTMPTGFTVSGSPITSSGVIAVSLASGYKLLQSSTATPGTYTKVTVDTYGRVTAGSTLAKADIPSLDYIPITGSESIAGKLEPLTNASYDLGSTDYRWRHGYFSGTVYATTFSGNATSASKLSTVSKTAWGQTYWTSGGVPTNVSGDMTSVGSITADYFKLDNTASNPYLEFMHTYSGTDYTFYVQAYQGSLYLGSNATSGIRINSFGNVVQLGTGRGYFLLDSTGYSYPIGFDNGENLWIGATATAATHHRGQTFISAGHNGTNGNSTIRICVPNAANNGGTNYYALHSGNYSTYLDDIYVNVTGDTMTGDLTIHDSVLYFTGGAAGRKAWINKNGTFIFQTTTSGGWATGKLIVANDGSTSIGYSDGALGSANTLTYYFYGGNYDSPWVVLKPNSSATFYMGVGLTNPTQKLHVSGNILATGAVTALSDMRQKSFLANVTEPLENIANLPVFYYRWKDESRDQYLHIGTSAQAVQQLFPELVLGADELSVDYGVLGTTIGILLSKRIMELEAKIKTLEERQ